MVTAQRNVAYRIPLIGPLAVNIGPLHTWPNVVR